MNQGLSLIEIEERLLKKYHNMNNRGSHDKSELEIFSRLTKTTNKPLRFYKNQYELYSAIAQQKKNSPNEVVFKILPKAPKGYAVKKLMEYISKDGNQEISTEFEDELGNTLKTEKDLATTYSNWSSDFSTSKAGKDAIHLILSTKGEKSIKNKEIIKNSVRSILTKRFNSIGLNYVFAYHQNGSHPHIHVILKKRNRITQKQFNFKKNDPLIFGIRKDFSEELTKRGLKREVIFSKNYLNIKTPKEILQKTDITIQRTQDFKQQFKKSKFEAELTLGEVINNFSSLTYLKQKRFIINQINFQIREFNQLKSSPQILAKLNELKQIKKDIWEKYTLSDKAVNLQKKSIEMVDQLLVNFQISTPKQKQLDKDLVKKTLSELTDEKVFIIRNYSKNHQRNKVLTLIDKKINELEICLGQKTILRGGGGFEKLKNQALIEYINNIKKNTQQKTKLFEFKKYVVENKTDYRTSLGLKLISQIEKKTNEIKWKKTKTKTIDQSRVF